MTTGKTQRACSAIVVALLTLAPLAGCGGDDSPSGSGGYCDDLEATRESFVGLLDNQIGQDTFVKLRDSLHTLQDESPAAVKDDWTKVRGAIDTFSVAMEKAHLTMDDMRDMGTGHMPGGEDMETAMDAAAALGSAEFSTAESAIAAHANRACGIDLNS